MSFNKFKRELENHHNNGYHSITSAVVDKQLWSDLIMKVNPDFTEFITQVGAGIFYAGSLQLFSIGDERFNRFNSIIHASGYSDFVAIGYDGTTEGCFCIRKVPTDTSVYWYSYSEEGISLLYEDFMEWIESTPTKMFNEEMYKAYKEIKDIEGIRQIICEREKFDVKIKKYEEELSAHPTSEKKYMKRYNRVIFEIKKNKPSPLQELTIKMLRSGSSVGESNVEYVTVDVESISSGEVKEMEAFLFDPFNLPFKEIICLFKPEIDLNSKMRVKYKEILHYL